MVIDRRQFLVTSGAAIAAPASGTASPPASGLYLSSARIAGDKHAAVLFDEAGEIHWQVDLPDRGHGGAFRPTAREMVMFARRPGTFAFVFERSKGQVLQVLMTPEHRHFYGHGTYSVDGRLLFTTENDFHEGRGVIGVWDASNGYKRVAEFGSGGTGPHDISLMPGGRQLVVANGGILTSPDTGRHKLNVADMKPSLAFIDVGDGALLSRHELPGHLRKLSIRHIGVSQSGTVVVAMQYEGPRNDLVPLVCRYQAGALHLMAAPRTVTERMQNYCGSVALDSSGQVACVTAPRGHITTFWDVEDGTFLASISAEDGCGVASTRTSGEFLVSSGTGRIVTANPADRDRSVLKLMRNLSWDNHLSRSSGYQ